MDYLFFKLSQIFYIEISVPLSPFLKTRFIIYMMKRSVIDIEWRIFRMAVDNSLSQEDQVIFDKWLHQGKANREYFKKALAFYRDQDNIEDADPAEAFRQLEETIRKKRLMGIHWLKAAAAIFLLIVGGTTAYLLLDKNEYLPVSYAEKIIPASGTVTLTLSDGQIIELNENTAAEIRDGEASITKSDRALTYTTSDAGADEEEEFNTLNVPAGNDYKLILSDGTAVWLNAMSGITYPLKFSQASRTVTITGEAYFEVAHNEASPFTVNVNGTRVTVLGTKFNINSYNTAVAVYTTLVQGKVVVKNVNGDYVVLKPGEQSLSVTGEDITVRTIDVNLVTDWTRGHFDFENQKLINIMDELSRWYDINVIYESDEIKDYEFTGFLERYQDINGLLKLFELTRSVEFYLKDNNVIVKKWSK
jgi:ferric-dicitrate binding protein FerR (iron transport regulator)